MEKNKTNPLTLFLIPISSEGATILDSCGRGQEVITLYEDCMDSDSIRIRRGINCYIDECSICGVFQNVSNYFRENKKPDKSWEDLVWIVYQGNRVLEGAELYRRRSISEIINSQYKAHSKNSF